MSTERKHHPYSPSQLQYLEACPGYLSESGSSEAADRGTRLHDACELGNEWNPNAFTDEENGVIEKCRDFVVTKVQELAKPGCEGASIIKDVADLKAALATDDPILIQEAYLKVDEQETTAGFLDNGILSWCRKRACVLDWKMGDNPVEPAKNNLQGMAYLLGLFFLIPTLEEVEVVFSMPFQGVGGTTDSHTFFRSEFEHLLTRVKIVVERAKIARKSFEDKSPRMDLLTGRACLFCARKGECPKAISMFIEVGYKYDPLVIPATINPMLPLNQEEAGQMLKVCQVVEAIAKAYRARLTERCVNEEDFLPDGYMLTSVSRRSISDKVKFAQIIKPRLTEEEFWSVIDFTLGPVEKLIESKAQRGGKKAAVEALAEELEQAGATTRGEPIPVLRQKKERKAIEN